MRLDEIKETWLLENGSYKPRFLTQEEIDALLEVLEDDEENEERERKIKSKIVAFLRDAFSEDKFIRGLIHNDDEIILYFLKDAFFYASLDEDAPDWVKKDINDVDYSTWLETFPNLSKSDLSYLRYLIVWGYKNYLEEKVEEIRKMKERLLKEESEYHVLNEMQKYLSEEEKLISPSKDIQNAAEQAMKEIDVDDAVESIFNK